MRGHTEFVRALGGTHGADLDAQDSGGSTPLHFAAYYGKTAAARALLELGADASLRTKQGKTALEIAEAKGNPETAELLRDHAASPAGKAAEVAWKVAEAARGQLLRDHAAAKAAEDHAEKAEEHAVELETVEITGATATLGWTVERLGRAIGEQRGVAPELLRLIVNEQALDGKGSLLLPACSIGASGEITRVHVVPPQTAEQAAARRAAAASAGVIEEGRPPAAAPAAVRQRRRGGGWCCWGPPTAVADRFPWRSGPRTVLVSVPGSDCCYVSSQAQSSICQ